MSGVSKKPERVSDYMPTLREGRGSGGTQQVLTVPMGTPLLVNGTTYRGCAFVAPCNGCRIIEGWVTAAVAISGGTNTLAIDNYDVSATSARNVLSTTNIDPTSVTALNGKQLTFTSTAANLVMDEGDVLNFTLVCGTMSTPGQGYALTVIINVPDIA